MFCSVFLAVIQICDPYRGSESFQCSYELFGAPASANLGQHMLRRPSGDAQRKGLMDLPRSLQALPGNRSNIDSNGSMKQFVAVDLPAFTTEIAICQNDWPLCAKRLAASLQIQHE
jgi:hypothetical protein